MKNPSKVSLLIVDDSLVFRKFLGDVFEDSPKLMVVGEATNGIEALDMVLKTKPDVILLDMEMPLMDGMTALQHMMIHRPTPTIMFSSLTSGGTARCFDTLKNGAVDFVCKDFIFQKSSLLTHKKLLIDKVQKAAQLTMYAKEPVFNKTSPKAGASKVEQRVVFCEECGSRETVTIIRSQPVHDVTCSQCGDTIELSFTAQSQYRRNTFITVLGGGEGSFLNLLQIIPQLSEDMNGSLIAVVHQDVDHVDAFAEYLDAISPIKVIRAREGVNIEGGNCYITSGADYMSIKPYSAQLTLQKVPVGAVKGGPLDILLASVSTAFKKKAAGIILSGDERDGDRGMAILIKNGGKHLVLDGRECYCKTMGWSIVEKCELEETVNLKKIVETVKRLHSRSANE